MFKPTWHKLSNGWYCVNIQKNASTAIKEHRVDHKYRKPQGKCLAVIRNPFDRLVSCYFNRFSMPWDKFIDYVCKTSDEDIDAHCRPQYLYLDYKPTRLINFENLQEEFSRIGIELKVRNKSDHKHWSAYFSEEDKERIYERYEEDFKLWQAVTQ